MKELKKYSKEYQPYLISVGIIVLVIIIGLSIGGKKSDVLKDLDQSLLEENVDTTDTIAPKTSVSSIPKTTTTKKISYAEALNTYKDRRIQFSETCYATPSVSTYKNGTEIMLDNRSAQSKTFRLGSVAHTIGAYDFKIVKLSFSSLPTEVLIDCGLQQNVATVIVQS